MADPIAAMAATDAVENVVLFVSDALRRDFLPSTVAELGVTARAVAPSTYTASALPSLTTGQYPAGHEVWTFEDRLPATPPLLSPPSGSVGFDAETVWTELPPQEKPPLRIHRLSTERTLADLSSPFTYVVHDVGPHAPYGFENGVFESTKAYFRDFESRRPQLVELYREDCRNSARRFLDIYSQLADRGELQDTLIVFTSDHGQCLGETTTGGRFGHGHPMCPETLEIPVVFAGAGLPNGERYDTLLSGVDIAPTLLGAQGRRVPTGIDGIDLWNETPPSDRRLRADVWQHLTLGDGRYERDLTVYEATSIWSDQGGYVFHRDSRLQRSAALAYDNLFRGYSPAWRENLSLRDVVAFASLALSSEVSYGTPDFSVAQARREMPQPFESDRPTDDTLSTEQKSHLKNLGYLG